DTASELPVRTGSSPGPNSPNGPRRTHKAAASYEAMKTVILAGGLGTRLAEETEVTPKPMVEIGGSPILWHIMKIYSSFGFREFVLALGYRAEVVKRYFLDYYRLRNDLTITGDGKVEGADGSPEDWRIDRVGTGIGTMTGGRIKRLADRL